MTDLRTRLAEILATFRTNVSSVQELMRFDSQVVDTTVQLLELLQERLVAVHGADNSRLNVTNTLAVVKNIRTNDSLARHYRQMLNQCNVLLVSYFSAAVGDVFRAGVADAIRSGTRPAILEEEIKLNFRELREIGSELSERSGDLLAEHREISFQNIHGVAKTFRDYFDYHRHQDETVNDLILSHACRHVTVHCGGIADRKMLGQLRTANPRSVKPNIQLGQHIQFTEEEIIEVGFRMDSYLSDLSDGVGAGTAS